MFNNDSYAKYLRGKLRRIRKDSTRQNALEEDRLRRVLLEKLPKYSDYVHVVTPKGEVLLNHATPPEDVIAIARTASNIGDQQHLVNFAHAMHKSSKTAASAVNPNGIVIHTPYGPIFYSHELSGDAGFADLEEKYGKVYNCKPKATRRTNKRKQLLANSYFIKLHDTQRHEATHLATALRRPYENLQDRLISELASVASESSLREAIDSAENWLERYAQNRDHPLKSKFANLITEVNTLSMALKKHGRMRLSTILSDPEIKTLDDVEQILTHLRKEPKVLGAKRGEILKWAPWHVNATQQVNPSGYLTGFKISETLGGHFADSYEFTFYDCKRRKVRRPCGILSGYMPSDFTPDAPVIWPLRRVVVLRSRGHFYIGGKQFTRTSFLENLTEKEKKEFKDAIAKVQTALRLHAPKARRRKAVN